MKTLEWIGLCGAAVIAVGCAGSEGMGKSASQSAEELPASADTKAQTGVATWSLQGSSMGTRIEGLTDRGAELVSLEAVLHDDGFTMIRSAYDDQGHEVAHDETEVDASTPAPVVANKQALTGPRMVATSEALTISSSQLIASMNADLTAIDTSGGTLTVSTGTKTPCEKARNQFVRAQAALQQAVDADHACEPNGYDRPRCQPYADAVDAAYAALQTAYQNYMHRCPNG